MPKHSTKTQLIIAKNANCIAGYWSNFLLTKRQLSPSAHLTLWGAIRRMLADVTRPHVEEIYSEEAAFLLGKDWAWTSDALSREVAEKPGSKPHWFLAVGVDVSGEVRFKVLPVAMAHRARNSDHSIEALQKFMTLAVLEQFAVLLDLDRHPKRQAKL